MVINTIFFRLFIAFLLGLLVFMAIMLVLVFLGFKNSMAQWEYEKQITFQNKIARIIETVIKENKDPSIEESIKQKLENVIMGNFTVFIYDKNKELLFHLQKHGFNIIKQDTDSDPANDYKMTPVKIDDEIEYYYSIVIKTKKDYADDQFLNSLITTVIISSIISFVIATLFAIYFSVQISGQTVELSKGINLIANGNTTKRLTEKGIKEIALIAKSTNILSEKLQKEQRIRSQWAQDIAHDLRTPTASIKMQVQGIIDEILENSKDRFIYILNEINHIEHLINDLSDLTHLESPELKLNIKQIKTIDYLNEITGSFKSAIEKKKINFTIKNSIHYLNCDKTLFHRAISNILHNAIKYSRENDAVSITTIQRNENKIINIFNSGSYINETEQEKIFDRLYRGEYSRNTEGTGLGLTIANKIVELHNGSIQVKSIKNSGTTFSVILRNSKS